MTRADLTVVILTYNEERHIGRAIASLRGLAREVLVIDSHSTDATVSLARGAGARVLQNPFTTHARQFNWALDHGDIATGWTMRLDADEVLEPALVNELAGMLADLPDEVSGIEIDRKHIFLGRWIRHGGRFPVRLLRVWRTGSGRLEDRWMDEHVVLQYGKSVRAHGHFADENINDLTFFTAKHNDYATREAIEVLIRRYGLNGQSHPEGRLPRQAAVKRWLKHRIYERLPFGIGALAYFLYRYVVQRGFLDGREGVIYHVLQGFWYRFLVHAKVMEFDRAMRGAVSAVDRTVALSRVSGHPIAHVESLSGIDLQPSEAKRTRLVHNAGMMPDTGLE